LITYIDTSVLLKLLLDDEDGTDAAQQLWLDSRHLVCAEIGYVEARAALGAARRANRLSAHGLKVGNAELNELWAQIAYVPITTTLIVTAGAVTETEGLRGYDAVHLTSALAADSTVMASADKGLLAAAARNGLDTSNPLGR